MNLQSVVPGLLNSSVDGVDSPVGSALLDGPLLPFL